jgi:hypothetical protein
MKIMRVLLIISAALAVLLMSCKTEEGPTQGEGFISGIVTDAATRLPLPNFNVQATLASGEVQTTTTKAGGDYSFTFTIDSAVTATVSLRNNTGYRDTLDIPVVLRPGVPVNRDIQLNAKSVVVGGGGVTGGSGLAQTIAFLGASPQEISVYGVGGLETSILGYEVRDSLGNPIDAAHAVTLQFSELGGPNGGEYISPPNVTTNAAGRAYTTVNSGIKSGVMQIVASATVGGRVIASSPVRLTINAGFPDQDHFTVAAFMLNFPTIGIAGNRDQISVVVGDKYSNPVAANTAVYFKSGAGVIQSSVFTNKDGQGTVDLISGNPEPLRQYATTTAGEGYHYVYARTIGDRGATVIDSILILWTGQSMITNVVPDTFTVEPAGYRNFTFTVSDYLGHPLARGTTILVKASVPPAPDPNTPVNQVQLAFGKDGVISFDRDYLVPGQGTTDFSFKLSDGTANITQRTAVSVSISVSGPNGNAYKTIDGIVW